MRHLTAGDKSVLTGDTVSELLIRYTALLVQQHTADTIDLAALELSGTPTTVSLLLSSGLNLTTETTDDSHPVPDNSHAEQYLRTRIDALIREQNPSPDEIAGTSIWNTDDPSGA